MPQGRREGKVGLIAGSLWAPSTSHCIMLYSLGEGGDLQQRRAETLRGLPTNVANRIRGKVEQYVADPASQANNVKALQGEKGYLRLRVGDWRVIFREDGSVVLIVRVAPRGSAYD